MKTDDNNTIDPGLTIDSALTSSQLSIPTTFKGFDEEVLRYKSVTMTVVTNWGIDLANLNALSNRQRDVLKEVYRTIKEVYIQHIDTVLMPAFYILEDKFEKGEYTEDNDDNFRTILSFKNTP